MKPREDAHVMQSNDDEASHGETPIEPISNGVASAAVAGTFERTFN